MATRPLASWKRLKPSLTQRDLKESLGFAAAPRPAAAPCGSQFRMRGLSGAQEVGHYRWKVQRG